MNKKRNDPLKGICFFCSILIPLGLFFPVIGNAMDINVRAIVEAPMCEVNDGNIVEIDFGDALLTTKIDGVNYGKKVPFTLTCPGVTPSSMQLQIKGQASGFDSNALATTKDGLGISFLQNKTPMRLNNNVNLDPEHLPELFAIPVKEPGYKLTSGEFSATSTLAVYYD